MTDTWCVYQPEFVAVYASEARGNDGRDECVAVFDRTWRGKITDEDWRLKNTGVRPYRYELQLKLHNLKGEYKDRNLALERSGKIGRGAVVVKWGSPEEQQLLDYGDRQLSAQ